MYLFHRKKIKKLKSEVIDLTEKNVLYEKLKSYNVDFTSRLIADRFIVFIGNSVNVFSSSDWSCTWDTFGNISIPTYLMIFPTLSRSFSVFRWKLTISRTRLLTPLWRSLIAQWSLSSFGRPLTTVTSRKDLSLCHTVTLVPYFFLKIPYVIFFPCFVLVSITCNLRLVFCKFLLRLCKIFHRNGLRWNSLQHVAILVKYNHNSTENFAILSYWSYGLYHSK